MTLRRLTVLFGATALSAGSGRLARREKCEAGKLKQAGGSGAPAA